MMTFELPLATLKGFDYTLEYIVKEAAEPAASFCNLWLFFICLNALNSLTGYRLQVTELLGYWVTGLLGCWVSGCWVSGCWVTGSIGSR